MGKSIINAYTYSLIHTKKAINLDYDELPVDSPERKRLPLLLRRAWYNLNKTFRRRISHAGATPDQFTVLRTLHEGDAAGLTQSQLTRAMSSDPNTVSSLLERMEKGGWIERRPHETDRRANRILLKPAGKRKFTQLRDIAAGLQLEILDVLPRKTAKNFSNNWLTLLRPVMPPPRGLPVRSDKKSPPIRAG